MVGRPKGAKRGVYLQSHLVKCQVCGKEFRRTDARGERKFCSRGCYWKSLVGRKHTKENIEKMKNGWKNISIKTRENMSNGQIKKWDRIGRLSKQGLSWVKNKRNRTKRILNLNGSSHTYGEWELLKKQYDFKCPRCGMTEPFNQRSRHLTEDHIIPLSKGGSDNIENIQPLCLSCNIKKHTKSIKY